MSCMLQNAEKCIKLIADAINYIALISDYEEMCFM